MHKGPIEFIGITPKLFVAAIIRHRRDQLHLANGWPVYGQWVAGRALVGFLIDRVVSALVDLVEPEVMRSTHLLSKIDLIRVDDRVTDRFAQAYDYRKRLN